MDPVWQNPQPWLWVDTQLSKSMHWLNCKTQDYIMCQNVHICIFRMRWSWGEMCIGHSHLCVCLSVPRHTPSTTLLHGPGWALLGGFASVHGFHCYVNIHAHIQYYRRPVQCKWILIDVNAIWTTASHFNSNVIFTTSSQVQWSFAPLTIWTTPSHVQQKLAPNVKR